MFPDGKLVAGVHRAGGAGDRRARRARRGPRSTRARFLIVAEDGRRAASIRSRAKSCRRCSRSTACRDFAAAAALADAHAALPGRRSLGRPALARRRSARWQLGLTLPVCRVIVNQAHCFATGGSFDNALPFSLSMGCGTWGGNSISDNLNYRHFLNITRVVHPLRAGARARADRGRAVRRRTGASTALERRAPARDATFRDVIDAHAGAQPGGAVPARARAGDHASPTPSSRATPRGFARDARSARRSAPARSSRSCCPTASPPPRVFLGAMYGGYVVSPINLLAQDAHARVHARALGAAHRVRGAGVRRAPRSAIVARDRQPRDRACRPRPRRPRARRDVRDAAPPRSTPTPGDADVHVGHDRHAQGRAAVARQHDPCRARGGASARADAGTTACCRRCRSITSTASASAIVSPLVSGGSIVMPHRFSVSQWWALVERYRPTWLNVVPTIIAYLLNGADLDARAGATRAAACASRARRRRRCRPSSIARSRRASASRVLEAMGLTECASVAFANPLDPARAQDRLARAAARRARRASSAPDGARAGRRRARRDRAARRQRDARLLQGRRRRPRATLAPAAGSRPATSAIATPTASTSSPAA